MRPGRVIAPFVVAVLVAACSGAAATPAPTTAPTPSASVAPSATAAPASPAPSAAASAAPSQSAASGYGGYGGATGSSASPVAPSEGLAIAQTSLGGILVGPAGMTLYMFLPDTATTSACTGSCASLWPPLTGALPSLGTGLSAADFGSLTRSNGVTQVTFHGHPLYYYSGDKAAGDTNGQGLNGKWYVLGTDGNPIK